MLPVPAPKTPGPLPGLGRLVARGQHADVHEWLDGSVIKVHRGAHAHDLAQAEATALSLASHRHVVPLLDVVANPLGDGGAPGLVLPRLSSRSAGELLRARHTISAGEAVTLLVPVLGGLRHLARSPVAAHADLVSYATLDSVLLDEHGAPVLTGVRATADSGPERLWRPLGGADGAARRLSAEVLERTKGGEPGARARLTAAVSADATLDELAELLYDLAEPVAIDDEALSADPFPEPPSQSPLDDLVPGLALAREWWAARRQSESGSLKAHLARIRPRVWLLAVTLGVSAVLGPMLVRGAGTAPVPASSSLVPSNVPSPVSSPLLSALPSQVPSPLPSQVPSRSPAPSSPHGAEGDDEATLTGDDAAAAADLLLELRDTCLAALDPECLRQVDESDGEALRADLAAVQDPSRLPDLPRPRVGRVLNEFGGVVLIEAEGPDDEPASLLVTRTEAGWRLRSLG